MDVTKTRRSVEFKDICEIWRLYSGRVAEVAANMVQGLEAANKADSADH